MSETLLQILLGQVKFVAVI